MKDIKDKLLGYIVMFVLISFLLYYAVQMLLEIWWILAIIVVLTLAGVVIYRIVRNRHWH